MNQAKFIAIIKDVLFRAKRNGFPKRAGICSYFFLFYTENKLTLQEYKDIGLMFKRYRPNENFFSEFTESKAFRKTESSDMWWFTNEEGYEQRILYLEKLIKHFEIQI